MIDKKQILFAIRPKTLMASIGPVILGLSLTASKGYTLNITTALVTLICCIFLQISSNLINDYYDAKRGIDSDDRLGPTRLANINKEYANIIKNFAITTMLTSLLFGIYLMLVGGVPIVVIGFCALLFAFLYTGGPFPLSYYGLGEILAFIFFGPVAVWGTFYLQTKTFQFADEIFLYGYIPGIISACIMSINNLRDRLSDSKTTKRTMAIFLGEKKARSFTVMLALLPNLIILYFVLEKKQPPLTLLTFITTLLFYKTWKSILYKPITEEFNMHLASTGKYLFIFCALYSILISL